MNGALATESEAVEPLDYEALYAGYLASLVDNLRGFRAAAPGLELWVPDEDPLASLSNLLDAAMVVGRRRVLVRLSARIVERLGADLQRLLPMAQAYGDARVTTDGDGVLLDVSGLDAPAPRRTRPEPRSAQSEAQTEAQAEAHSDTDADPRASGERPRVASPGARVASRDELEATALSIYRPALEQAAFSPRHRGSLAGEPGQVALRACSDAAELSLVVDATTHRIVSARHDARQPLQLGLLERLCDVIVGLPLLEAAEHGSLRLEQALRGSAPRPVAGILLPESVHPLFRLARVLLVDALSDYRRQTGFDAVHSRHDDRPGESWSSASDAERRTRLEGALGAALTARGLDPGSAHVEAIRYEVRVELSLELPPDADAPVIVTGLERALQADVDPRLEVYVTERRDRNAKRRLAVLGGEA